MSFLLAYLNDTIFQFLTMKIEHLFFDLDRTLWDFETNSYEELTNLYHVHSLHQLEFLFQMNSLRFIKILMKIVGKIRLNQLSKKN